MALLALASNRSPGVTTAAKAMALVWPAPRTAIVAELDPSGGTIAARQVVPHDPGLLALAAAGSHGLSDQLVLDHLQRLAHGPTVLLGPPGPDRAAAALRALIPAGLLTRLRDLPGRDVIADCGRLDASSPALPVLADADLTVFVARPTTQDIIGLEHRLQTLGPAAQRAGLVVVGRRPYPPEEVARVCGLSLIGVLEDDVRTAERVADGVGAPLRSALLRSAAAVADVLVRDLPDPPPTTGAEPEPTVAVPSARPPSVR